MHVFHISSIHEEWTTLFETSRDEDGKKFKPKRFQQQVMSVNHESEFSGHLGAKKQLEYFQTSFGQDYARMSLDSAVPVMCAKEQSRRVLLNKAYRPNAHLLDTLMHHILKYYIISIIIY